MWKGRQVKACFGTTKYCNAFLKGVPCNNHDCLYLHELGAPRVPVLVLVLTLPVVGVQGQQRLAAAVVVQPPWLLPAACAAAYAAHGCCGQPSTAANSAALPLGSPCAADEADCLTKEEVAAGLLPARFMALGGGGGFKPRLAQHTVPAPHVSALGWLAAWG